jgi:hypothetical protein
VQTFGLFAAVSILILMIKMTDIDFQIAVSLATILCSGVVSAIVTQKLSAGRAEREFRRRKLEELFFAVHTYCTKLFSVNFIWVNVMRREMDYNAALKLIIIETNQKEDKSHDIVMMLVNIYFPEMRSKLEAIMQRRTRINKIQADFKKAYIAGLTSDINFVDPFMEELKGIDDDEKAMTELLFRVSRRYQ